MLQYGVIVGNRLKAWELACVREIQARGLARLRCTVAGVASAGAASAIPYEHLCAAVEAQSQRDVSPNELEGWSDSFVPLSAYDPGVEWQWRLRDLGLDFVLAFGDVEIGDVLERLRYGVWRFVYGDPERFSASVPGFWEMYRGYGVTSASLVRSSAAGDIVLKCGHLSTNAASFSRNVDAICKAMSAWPSAVCANVADGAATYLDGPASVGPQIRYGRPSAAQAMLLRCGEACTRLFEYLRSRLFSIDWNVGLALESPSDFIGRDARPNVKYLFPARTYTYVADPCLVRFESRTLLFCERYNHRSGRGLLVHSELNGKHATNPSVAIQEPHHLSYPHVFEKDGRLYCIPESAQANKVCLYRFNGARKRWEFVRTLVDNFAAADSTVVRHNGKWWMFCTSAKVVERGFNSHLYVWYADDLFGKWKPHVGNPVKIDARSARCAGPFFTHEGALYRPVQDCGASYGTSIHLARVDVLTEREFKETIAGTIRAPAGRYRSGIHTISAAGDVCVVDARRYAFSPWRIGVALQCLVRRAAPKFAFAEVPAHAKPVP